MRSRTLPPFAAALLGCWIAAVSSAALPARAQDTAAARAPKAEAKPSGRATRKVVPVTVHSVNGAVAVLKPTEGTVALITATLSGGIEYHRAPANKNQPLRAGENVVARLSFYPDGRVVVTEVWDAALYAEEQRLRKDIVVGVVEVPLPGDADSGTLTLRSNQPDRLITYRVTDKTLFYKGGVPVKPSAYAKGATVAVKPRALPSGGYMASVVAESLDALDIAYADTLTVWKGEVVGADADKFTLSLDRTDGASRTVTVPNNLTITDEKSRNKPNPARTYKLTELPGRSVIIRLIRGERPGHNGARTAAQVTVSDTAAPRSKSAPAAPPVKPTEKKPR